MKPAKIQVKSGNLILSYSDGNEKSITLQYLRDECPCAGCKGETILLRTFKPSGPRIITPDSYKVASITPVGDYAIQIAWKDGHTTGIYSWDYIQTLLEGMAENKKQDYDKLI